jgi:hypothetical protein
MSNYNALRRICHSISLLLFDLIPMHYVFCHVMSIRVCGAKTFLLLWLILVACVSLPIWAHHLTDLVEPPPQGSPGRGLPDPLVAIDGTMVDGPDEWYGQRRDELKLLFQHYIYGYMPEAPEIDIHEIRSDPEAFGGIATYRELIIRFPQAGSDADEPRIILSVFTPNRGKGPYPAFVTINRCGNHTVSDYRGITIFPSRWEGGHCRNDESGRGSHSDFWSIELILRNGYAFATFHEADVDADSVEYPLGIQPYYEDFFTEHGVSKEMTWGTIAVWSWGVSRALDALETLPDIDGTRITAVGHSRRGKSVLVAAAFDERIDLVIPHQAGTGAEALNRGLVQEPVFVMNRAFPHWFNAMYKSYNYRIGQLPVDQHELLALVAPRGVLLTAARSYWWGGPSSSLHALQAADDVFKMLGARGLSGTGIIWEGEVVSNENATGLSQYRRRDGHRLDPEYWQVFIDYASAYFAGLSQTAP